jgi:integrase/recombinase XerD
VTGNSRNNPILENDRFREALHTCDPSRPERLRRWFRLLEKGGKHHEVPVHHKAQDYVAEYLEKARFEPNKPLFQTFHKKQPTGRPMSRTEAYRMIRRRALAAGISAPVCCHSFRATGITVYLENKNSRNGAENRGA